MSSGSKGKTRKKQSILHVRFVMVHYLASSLILKMEVTCFFEISPGFNGLQGGIIQKTGRKYESYANA
jgi:hypothetical protein